MGEPLRVGWEVQCPRCQARTTLDAGDVTVDGTIPRGKSVPVSARCPACDLPLRAVLHLDWDTREL